MIGIKSFGAYIPSYRLSRAVISQAWGGGPARGEKAVANHDEDSITMAIEAVLNCISGMDPATIDGLYFATTSAPYREKQSASLIATVADLGREIRTADFCNSLRSSTIALMAACDAVKSGSAKNLVVVASDCRLGNPESDMEQIFGDGAAAVVVSDSDLAAAIEGDYTQSIEFIDYWRRDQDRFVRTDDARFIVSYGYTRLVNETIAGIMKKYSFKSSDISKVAIYNPDGRSAAAVLRGLGFDPKKQLQDGLYDSVGNTGTAMPLMSLVAALEEAGDGDKILLVSYGDGCDALILKVGPKIGGLRDRHGIKYHIGLKRNLDNYVKYLRFRRLLIEED